MMINSNDSYDNSNDEAEY